MGTLMKSRKIRMSPEKQETLLKLSILSLAAILCKYICYKIYIDCVLIVHNWLAMNLNGLFSCIISAHG